MSMRNLTDAERVLIAQFRLCGEEIQAEIQNLVHEKAQNAQIQTVPAADNTEQE